MELQEPTDELGPGSFRLRPGVVGVKLAESVFG